jgi:hypothetical protein
MKPIHVAVIAFITALIGFGSIFVLGRDNPVEQISEAIIKDETGIDIDFTPENEQK